MVPLALELGHDDLVDVEEAVLLEADLDERGLHAREDVVDRAEVDVAGDRAALRPLEVDLGDAVVLEDRDALLADVDGDQQLALGLRQRRALLRHAAAVALLVGAALLPLAALRPPGAGCLGCAGRLQRPGRERSRRAGWSAFGSDLVSPSAPATAPGFLRPRPPRLPRRRFLAGSVAASALSLGGGELSLCGLLYWSGRLRGRLLLGRFLALPSEPG